MTKDNIKKPQRIAIFASGAGSNAARLMQHFTVDMRCKIVAIVVNNPTAAVISIAQKYGISTIFVEKNSWLSSNHIVEIMAAHKIDFIVLAGFLWRVPEALVAAFPNKIINLHPALLPKFGGKGMYGMNVHKAVVAAAETETGITIHYVNAAYDEGAIIAQYRCSINKMDTPESVATKIKTLEETHFLPTVLDILYNH
jgi:phosphoribosylglycinamide formyltransferase-1